MSVDYYVDREISDMEQHISALRELTKDLGDDAPRELTLLVEEVVAEWKNYTKPCIEQLADEVDRLNQG